MGRGRHSGKAEHMTTNLTPVPAGAIVVGVDGSEGAALAVEWAAEHARLVRRPLALVHGWDTVPSIWLDQVGVDHVALQAEIETAARQLVAAAAARVAELAPEVEVVEVVRHEDARALLTGLAAHAETTVVGSRGRGPLKALLLGSVSSAVARHAHGTVVVVRPGGPRPGEGTGVLVAVDGEEGCGPAVEAAFASASLRGLPLTVLHCAYDARVVAGIPLPAESLREAEEEAKLVIGEAIAGLAEKFPEVEVRSMAVFGHVEHELLRAADGADLVVVGHRERHPVSAALLGSISRAFLERAHGAVMVVPEPH